MVCVLAQHPSVAAAAKWREALAFAAAFVA